MANERSAAALPPQGPNAEQIRFWNESAGPRWVAVHDRIARQLWPIGLEALDRAAIAPGSRVLDVGCGCGETTIEIARRVGPSGAVTGVDVSAVMLERAREDARAPNITYLLADAQTEALPEGAFDLLFSRFGVMFFSDPEAAFQNLRRALRRGARFTFLCWRALSENPWMTVPAAAVARLVAMPEVEPEAPGPFAFADADRVRGILTRAGFTGVSFERLDRMIQVGGRGELEEV